MTRVDFYILGSGGETERLQTACRIVEKAWQQGHQVYVDTADDDQARLIDDLLWTFKQASFIPHTRSDEESESERCVRIVDANFPPAGGVHINIATTALPLPLAAERLAEIIPASEDGRNAGRARFRDYRTAGYKPHTHNI